MAAADRKITYTAAEVAELIRPLTQSVEALQKENAELKRKLEHMNEILANAQRARFGQSSEKKTYGWKMEHQVLNILHAFYAGNRICRNYATNQIPKCISCVFF